MSSVSVVMSKRIRLNDNHLPWEMKGDDASVAEAHEERTESQRASSRMRYTYTPWITVSLDYRRRPGGLAARAWYGVELAGCNRLAAGVGRRQVAAPRASASPEDSVTYAGPALAAKAAGRMVLSGRVGTRAQPGPGCGWRLACLGLVVAPRRAL